VLEAEKLCVLLLEEEMMRRFALILAVVAVVSMPVFADYPISLVPLGTGATAPMRPEVNNGWIAAVNYEGSGNTGGQLFDVATLTQYGNVASIQLMNAGYWHEPQADISDNYAVFGGAPSNQSLTYGINVLNRNTSAVMNIAGTDVNEHCVSINNYGDVVWIKWAGNTPEAIMYSDVSSGTPTASIELVSNLTTAGQGERMRISTDARRLGYRPLGSGAELWVYDFATATNAKVFNTNGDEKAYFAGIDDTGNWMVSNIRSVAAGGQWSDIYLIDVTNLGAPAQYPLFGNFSAIREDPRMVMLDADTAFVVWDEDASGANSMFTVRGAYITGLTGTPTIGTPIDIASYSAGVRNARWADLDVDANGILVAWLNTATTQIEYTYIPEPATLALLALGGLALIRRR